MNPAEPTPTPDAQPKVRVLVVDDSPAMVRSLADFLGTLANVELVAVAGDGDNAIAACARLKPDLVLLDFAMPRTNGLEVARSVRIVNPAARIVMISNYSPFLAEAGPWPAVEAVVDKLELGQELPALLDKLFPPQ